MTQATPTIGTSQSGLQYRNADNDGKKALLNHHKGNAAPSYAEAGVIWLDDTATPWILKIYDGTDWLVIATVNASTNAVEAYHGAAALRLLNHATDTGSANAYAVAPAPATTAYVTGQIVTLKPANASTGVATLNVSGLGTKSIKTLAGADPASGALATTGIYTLVYDGTNFVLLNPSLGSAAYLTAGTSANNLVQLNGSAQLPAVSGALLTNLPASGALVKIATGTASNSATLDFLGCLSSAYDNYLICFETIRPATYGSDLVFQLTEDNSTWLTTGTALYNYTTNGAPTTFAGAYDSSNSVIAHDVKGAGTNQAAHGTINLTRANDAGDYTTARVQAEYQNNTNQYIVNFWGITTTTGTGALPVGMRFKFSSGNITSGTIKIYGVQN